MHVISGKWVFIEDELFFRVRYVANGKSDVVYAASAFSWDIEKALTLNGVKS